MVATSADVARRSCSSPAPTPAAENNRAGCHASFSARTNSIGLLFRTPRFVARTPRPPARGFGSTETATVEGLTSEAAVSFDSESGSGSSLGARIRTSGSTSKSRRLRCRNPSPDRRAPNPSPARPRGLSTLHRGGTPRRRRVMCHRQIEGGIAVVTPKMYEKCSSTYFSVPGSSPGAISQSGDRRMTDPGDQRGLRKVCKRWISVSRATVNALDVGARST